jgi:hypothetical protein
MTLQGLSLPIKPVLEGLELLLSEVKSPLALASLYFSDSEPRLLLA